MKKDIKISLNELELSLIREDLLINRIEDIKLILKEEDQRKLDKVSRKSFESCLEDLLKLLNKLNSF